MAKFTSRGLTFECRFREYDKGDWVQYELLFLWQGEPIINDALLKRHNEHWAARSYGAFKANEFEHDTLIKTLERVLATNQAGYWEPLEPDVIIGFYPGRYFPFLPSHWVPVDREVEQVLLEEKDNPSEYPASDDLVTVIVFVDAYNLHDCKGYSGEGIGLFLLPTRQELQLFLQELKEEYTVFVAEYDLNNRPKLMGGDKP